MRIFKYLTITVVLALVTLTLFGIGKCKYEEINDLISEGGGYGIHIGDTFPKVVDSLKNIPENYPRSVLHYRDNKMPISAPVSWNLVHTHHDSESLLIYYDTQSNYLDYLSINFDYGKADQIHRGKFCALNPEHNKFHRWVLDFLYWGADLLNIDFEYG